MVYTTKINWKKEIPYIKEQGSVGTSMTQLAYHYKVSRQRMKQVIDKHIPDWGTTCGWAVKRSERAEKFFEKWGHKEKTPLYQSQRAKFRSKKVNAKRTGYSWELSFGDLDWPTHCPILGLEIDYFSPYRVENSPSFDRIDSSKGYVKGNVHILSWRANRIKNDGSSKEHRQIAEYLDKMANVTP